MNEELLGHGAFSDPVDDRDYIYEKVSAPRVLSDEEWSQGFDIEKEIGCKIPFKNQQQSSSCVGQAFSYYAGVLNALEVGQYIEESAKAVYSLICQEYGGAFFRDGAAALVDFGAMLEIVVPSTDKDGTVPEKFMQDKQWITPEARKIARILAAKSYFAVTEFTMDNFARAIKDGHGMVAGVRGDNNGTWMTNEPKRPASMYGWNHALFFGKFGVDAKGKYIASPNSWGTRNLKDNLHPDDWQKYREDWFVENGKFLFCPWILIDKKNIMTNAKVFKDKNSPAIFFALPVKNPEAFKSYCANFGLDCPQSEDGSVNWGKVIIDGQVELK